MKTRMKTQTNTLCVLALTALAPAASAQFVGDMFFATPSVAVAEGDSVELDIVTFSGALAVGAAHLEIAFDPALLAIDEVLAVNPTGITPQVVDQPLAGRVGIAWLNDDSLSAPFGLITLARVRARPLAPAGTTIDLSITARGLLKTDATPFPATQGFGGEIVVVAAAALTAADDSTQTAVDGALSARAARLGRPGQSVTLMVPGSRAGLPSAAPRRVVIPPSAPPRERSSR